MLWPPLHKARLFKKYLLLIIIDINSLWPKSPLQDVLLKSIFFIGKYCIYLSQSVSFFLSIYLSIYPNLFIIYLSIYLILVFIYISIFEGSFRGMVANVLEFLIEVSEFEPQWNCNIPFQTNICGKGMNSLLPPAMG